MKKVLITQSNYIPWKGYFDAINAVDEFVIYDDMQYTKRDWRNRNKIKTPQGVQWLTIPVEVKGKFFQRINETIVSEPNWGQKHWKTIVQNYSKASYFNLYQSVFEEAYVRNHHIKLSEVNYCFIKIICEILNIETPIRWSSEFQLVEGKTERLVQICSEIGGTDYFSGPAAKDYLDEQIFNRANINVHYFNYDHYPIYSQLYNNFDHYVTILDLIFNEGPNASKYMKTFGK